MLRAILLALVIALVAVTGASALSRSNHRATVYSGPCDGQSTSMADGTHIASDGSLWKNGKRVDNHVLASSFLFRPHHTVRVLFDRKVYGARLWYVRDSGGAFDLYRPNCRWGAWNNPMLRYRVLR